MCSLAIYKTLMECAKCISSTTAQRQSKERRVINDLKANGYPGKFIKSVDQPNNTKPKPLENPKAYASIPYVKGVSERIRWILKRENIKTAFKPLKTLGNFLGNFFFDWPTKEQLNKTSWKSRGAKCKTGTSGNVGSAVNSMPKSLVATYTQIMRAFCKQRKNKDKILFLESLHSFLDRNFVSLLTNQTPVKNFTTWCCTL